MKKSEFLEVLNAVVVNAEYGVDQDKVLTEAQCNNICNALVTAISSFIVDVPAAVVEESVAAAEALVEDSNVEGGNTEEVDVPLT